jgi:hypothetical protein
LIVTSAGASCNGPVDSLLDVPNDEFPKTDRVRPEAEVSRIAAELSGKLELCNALGTAIVADNRG